MSYIKHKGVYALWNKDKLVYIGRSVNIFSRIISHCKESTKEFDRVSFYRIENNSDRGLTELFLIDKHKPKYNKLDKHTSNTTIKVDIPNLDEFVRLNIDLSKWMVKRNYKGIYKYGKWFYYLKLPFIKNNILYREGSFYFEKSLLFLLGLKK